MDMMRQVVVVAWRLTRLMVMMAGGWSLECSRKGITREERLAPKGRIICFYFYFSSCFFFEFFLLINIVFVF